MNTNEIKCEYVSIEPNVQNKAIDQNKVTGFTQKNIVTNKNVQTN